MTLRFGVKVGCFNGPPSASLYTLCPDMIIDYGRPGVTSKCAPVMGDRNSGGVVVSGEY